MAKQIIRLTESELKKILAETVKRVLNESSLIDEIDITQIPIEVLRQGYFDYRLVPQSTMYGNVLYEPATITEAVNDVLPPDTVVNNIIIKYRIPQQFVIKVEHYHKIYVYVITACIGKNDKLIEDDMNKMGYFLGARGEVVEIQNMRFQTLQFEPSSQLQEDITDLVKSKFDILYHWTPSYCVEGIQRNGLIPNHKNEVFNYPPRTYLMEGNSSDEQMWNLGQQLCIKNDNPNNNGTYNLIIVDIENLDDSIRFLYDPNSEIGIYTEQPIPSDRIQVGKTVQFVKKLR